MTRIKLNFTEYQLQEIANALKKQTSVKLRLSYEQITKKGKYKILLTKARKEKLDESKKIENGAHIRI